MFYNLLIRTIFEGPAAYNQSHRSPVKRLTKSYQRWLTQKSNRRWTGEWIGDCKLDMYIHRPASLINDIRLHFLYYLFCLCIVYIQVTSVHDILYKINNAIKILLLYDRISTFETAQIKAFAGCFSCLSHSVGVFISAMKAILWILPFLCLSMAAYKPGTYLVFIVYFTFSSIVFEVL